MKRFPKRKAGQGMVEYVIIVAVVALAAMAIFALFGDTIQKKLGGAIDDLEGDSTGTDAVQSSESYIQHAGDDGNN